MHSEVFEVKLVTFEVALKYFSKNKIDKPNVASS